MKVDSDDWFRKRLLERFIRYVKFDTTSNPHSKTFPTTGGQRELANSLKTELTDMGITDTHVDENGFVIARIEGQTNSPVIGLIAHMDTSPDVTGKNVKPIVHENYNGEEINLTGNVVISPEDSPGLKAYAGDTIITSDGTTLLGADDKAGVAEIMTAVEYMVKHPELQHGSFEVIFTPDEETGLGMSRFPIDKIKSKYCYTVDGSEEGDIEIETFNAYRVTVQLTGRIIHPGYARGKLINAITMATKFLNLIPESESPEATDGRFGYYYPYQISGNTEKSTIEILIRDFDNSIALKRIDALKAIATAVETGYSGGKVKLDIEKQYTNMGEYIKKEPQILSILQNAVKEAGLQPNIKYIRGGTDGARLSEMGIPTPNIFTGGHNFHSRTEWIALGAMVRATKTLTNLIHLWSQIGKT